MQLRISWQLLAAALIFLIGFCLLGSTLLRSYQAYQGPQPTTVAVVSPTATPEASRPPTAGSSGSSGNSEPTPGVTDLTPGTSGTPAITSTPPLPSLTPTPEPSPTATLSPTIEPTPIPPTSTPFIPPTSTATPAPQAVQLVGQGFSQLPAALSYAFVLTNPNPDLAAQQVRYQIAVYDQSGIVIRTASGEVTLIAPGQSTAVAGTLEIPADFQISRLDILLREGLFIRSGPLPPFIVENLALVPGERPVITGILRNPFDRDFENLPIVAVVYDEASTIIGGGNGTASFVPALGQVPIEVPVTSAVPPVRLAIFPQLIELIVPTPQS